MRVRFFVFGVLLSAWMGCASHMEKADEAFVRGEWDAAARNYEKALGDSSEPAEIRKIRENLDESRHQAALLHLSRARQLKTLNKIHDAFEQVRMSYEYEPTTQSEFLLNELRELEADRLVFEGTSAVSAGKWDAAVRSLRGARELRDDAEIDALLIHAETELEAYNEALFRRELRVARGHLSRRQWAVAVKAYGRAHRYARTPKSQEEMEFASLMTDAEKYAPGGAGRDRQRAVRKLSAALAYGIDTDYVREKLAFISPSDYRVTFHGATILPYKPVPYTPWDGPETDMRGETPDRKAIGRLMHGSDRGRAVVAGLMKPDMRRTIRPPDCYLEISFDGVSYGGRRTVDRDEYRPSWDFPMTFQGAAKDDGRIVGITVRDADETGDDNVGTFRVTLGELISEEGPHTVTLIDPDGRLRAGGILSLSYSVEKL